MTDKNIEDIISEYTCDCQKMNGSSDCYGCIHSDEYGHTCNLEGNIAQALSNAGYGKVEDYKKEIERLREENASLKKNWNRGIDIQRQEAFMEGSKRAIKEFSDKLSDKLIDFCEENENDDGTISVAYIYVDFLGLKANDGKIICRGDLDDLLNEGLEIDKNNKGNVNP